MLQQNVQAAKAERGKLNDKLNEMGGMGSNEEELSDLKPNYDKKITNREPLELILHFA